MVRRFKFFALFVVNCFEIAGFESCLVFLGFRNPKAPRLAVKFRLTPLKSFSRDSGKYGGWLPVATTGAADIGFEGCTETLCRIWSSAKRPQGKSASSVAVQQVCQRKQCISMTIKKALVKYARVHLVKIWKPINEQKNKGTFVMIGHSVVKN